jgi:hypothetical protein
VVIPGFYAPDAAARAARSVRCATVASGEINFLEATGETTLVRLRSARLVRDVRALGKICPILAAAGVSASTAITPLNVGRIAEIRRRG